MLGTSSHNSLLRLDMFLLEKINYGAENYVYVQMFSESCDHKLYVSIMTLDIIDLSFKIKYETF